MSPRKLTGIAGFLAALTVAGLAVGGLDRTSRAASEKDSHSGKKTSKEVSPEVGDLVESNSRFALDFYAHLAAENQGKNLFFSPYSVSSALSMVAEGARGETAEQMGKVLHYAYLPSRGGDEAKMLPWDADRLHIGMTALNDEFARGTQSAPKEIRERIDTLRKQFKAADQALDRAPGDGEAFVAASKKYWKIAAELNQLQGRYDQYELRIANALWGEKTYSFRQSYLDTLKKYYSTGGFFPVDFRHDFESARRRINAWIEERTNNRIKDILAKDAFDEEAKTRVRSILTNAIYFKGQWAEVFPKARTKDEDFLLSDGTKVRVPMMRRSVNEMSALLEMMPGGDRLGVRYAAFRGDGTFFDTPSQVPFGAIDTKKVYPDERGFTLLELPYKGGTMSMVVVLPRSANGLATLEKKLALANLATWIGKLRQRDVHIFLPRFKLETNYAVDKTLKAMGMVRAFEDPRRPNGAQFDGMSTSAAAADKLYIAKILHKAFVEVNEEGTEAAATSEIVGGIGGVPKEVPFTPTFRADRPFLLLIRDVRTGSILFLGRMMNPKKNG